MVSAAMPVPITVNSARSRLSTGGSVASQSAGRLLRSCGVLQRPAVRRAPRQSRTCRPIPSRARRASRAASRARRDLELLPAGCRCRPRAARRARVRSRRPRDKRGARRAREGRRRRSIEPHQRRAVGEARATSPPRAASVSASQQRMGEPRGAPRGRARARGRRPRRLAPRRVQGSRGGNQVEQDDEKSAQDDDSRCARLIVQGGASYNRRA